MNLLLVFASVTGVIFVYRFVGFSWNLRQVPALWKRFLRFIPISLFAALVLTSLYKESGRLDVKLVALAIAGIVIARTHQLWLSILLGLGTLWLLSWFATK